LTLKNQCHRRQGLLQDQETEACEKTGLTPYVPGLQRGSLANKGFFRKNEFRYDVERDAILLGRPASATRCESELRDTKKVDYANRATCAACLLHCRCAEGFRIASSRRIQIDSQN
jgi:hypothetical protein